MTMKWVVAGAGAVVVVAVLLAILPTPHEITTLEYSSKPEPSAFEGDYAPNSGLIKTVKIGSGMHGPETLVFDADGTMFGFSSNGWVVTISVPDGKVEKWAFTGGRPLSGLFDSSGDLLIVVANVGLCKVSRATRESTVLVSHVEDQFLAFADDIAIASDGKVYFTDATSLVSIGDYKLSYDLVRTSVMNYLEGKKTGRVIVYDPETRQSKVIMRNIFFANGITLSQNQDFLLVTETFELQVLRYWLRGPKAGSTDVFVKNLPGYPDGISTGSDGGFYIAIPSPPIPAALMLRDYPSLRSIMLKLPAVVQPKPLSYGNVVTVSADGKRVSTLQDPTGKVVSLIASITEHDGHLYFGSFSNDYVGQLKLPEEKKSI